MSQPLMNKKIAIRFGILIVVLGGLIYGFVQFLGYRVDPTATDTFDSKGQILALELLDEGSRVVMIDSTGKVTPAPGHTEGSTDREAIWKPDGTQIFFVSDREKQEPHIFRWSPGRNLVERRSLDSRSKGALSLTVMPKGNVPILGLMTLGGNIAVFDPATGANPQVLPPTPDQSQSTAEAADSQGGEFGRYRINPKPPPEGSPPDPTYMTEPIILGTSFKSARWGLDQQYIVAVLRRDEGEVLIMEDMTQPLSKTKPLVLAAGDRIEFDLNPITGEVAFVCVDFKFATPEQGAPYIKNGRQGRPFNHVVAISNPQQPLPVTIVAQQPDDKLAFSSVKYSPDGGSLLIAVGPYAGNGNVTVENLVKMPATKSGAQQTALLAKGAIRDASWSPDGSRVYFIRTDVPGSRPICSVNADGTNEQRITQAGRFANPILSPATK